MKVEHSYGIVPLKKLSGIWKVLLVQPHKGWWGIPKGHGDQGETPRQAAERELFEETHLIIKRYLSEASLQENYRFFFSGDFINKTVDYFVCEVQGRVKLQSEELKDSTWIDLQKAEAKATYKETKQVLKQTLELIAELSLD